MSKSWNNPYGAKNDTKAALADENYRRVQKRKAEQRFLQSMKANPNIENLDRIERELQEEDRTVVDAGRTRRPVRLIEGPKERAELRFVQQYASGIRDMEITQCGATIWTAENDGRIVVRSGGTGLVVFSVPEASSGVTVDRLYSTDTHMWCGLSDGTVQVFDHLVYIHVTEGQFHKGAVTSFATSFDGRTYSAAADGSIVKWDTESKNFEALTRIITGQASITAIACGAYSVFAAGDDGSIKVIDVESGAVQNTVSEHSSRINSLAFVNDVLFSAGDDMNLHVWNANKMEMIVTHTFNSAPTTMVVDAVSNSLWVGLQSGAISVLRTRAEDAFIVERTVDAIKTGPIVKLCGASAVDSVRLWTLASNGVNKMWSSSANLVEAGMVATIEALKGVISQDTVELDKWRTLVNRLQNVDNRRKVQMSNALELYHEDRTRRRFMWMWRQFLQLRYRQRRKVAIAARLVAEEHVLFARRFFSKWFRWYRHTQNVRLRTKFSDVLDMSSKKSVVLTYFRKLQVFSRHMKNTVQRQDLVNALGQHNSVFLQRIFLRKWLKFRNQRLVEIRRVRYAEQLLRATANGRLRFFFHRWIAAADRKALMARKQKVCETIMAVSISGARKEAFRKWMQFAQSKAHRERVLNAANCFLQSSNRGLMSMYFSKWTSACHAAHATRIRRTSADASAQLDDIKTKYAALEELMKEKRSLQELKREADQLDVEIQQRQMTLEHTLNQRNDLLRELEDKKASDKERTTSLQEQLVSLMSQLKAKVVNFYADHQLFQQVREKIKQGQPVTKIFLEAHQAVKRVIVELTKKPHLQNEHWPLTDEQVRKMPSHQMSVLLASIKTMIITFDVMDKETRDSLTTDSEIVMNADWLMLIADICASHRKKILAKR